MNEALEKKWNKRLKGRAEARQFGMDEFVKAMCITREGRDYLWWVLEISGINANPHTANALNTAFNCGQMNVGQQVLSHLMSVAPDGYFNMLKEREKEKNDDRLERARLEHTSAEPGESTSIRSDAESSV